jgi:hypothetical protein
VKNRRETGSPLVRARVCAALFRSIAATSRSSSKSAGLCTFACVPSPVFWLRRAFRLRRRCRQQCFRFLADTRGGWTGFRCVRGRACVRFSARSLMSPNLVQAQQRLRAPAAVSAVVVCPISILRSRLLAGADDRSRAAEVRANVAVWCLVLVNKSAWSRGSSRWRRKWLPPRPQVCVCSSSRHARPHPARRIMQLRQHLPQLHPAALARSRLVDFCVWCITRSR